MTIAVTTVSESNLQVKNTLSMVSKSGLSALLELLIGVDYIEELLTASHHAADTLSTVLNGVAVAISSLLVVADIYHTVKDKQEADQQATIKTAIYNAIKGIDGKVSDVVLSNIKANLNHADHEAVLNAFIPVEGKRNLSTLLEDLLNLATGISLFAVPPAVPFLLIAEQAVHCVKLGFELHEHIHAKMEISKEITYLNTEINKAVADVATKSAIPITPDQNGKLSNDDARRKVELELSKSILKERQAQLKAKQSELKEHNTKIGLIATKIALSLAVVAGSILTLFPATTLVGVAVLGAGIAGLVITAGVEHGIKHTKAKDLENQPVNSPVSAKVVEIPKHGFKQTVVNLAKKVSSSVVNFAKTLSTKVMGFIKSIPSWCKSRFFKQHQSLPEKVNSEQKEVSENFKPPSPT